MVNNINERGLSKSNKVLVRYFPGATSAKNTSRNGWNYQRKTKFYYHWRRNQYLINNNNWLNNAEKVVKKVRGTLPATKLALSSIFLRKDRRNIN